MCLNVPSRKNITSAANLIQGTNLHRTPRTSQNYPFRKKIKFRRRKSFTNFLEHSVLFPWAENTLITLKDRNTSLELDWGNRKFWRYIYAKDEKTRCVARYIFKENSKDYYEEHLAIFFLPLHSQIFSQWEYMSGDPKSIMPTALQHWQFYDCTISVFVLSPREHQRLGPPNHRALIMTCSGPAVPDLSAQSQK